jgi:hypothetical protein
MVSYRTSPRFLRVWLGWRRLRTWVRDWVGRSEPRLPLPSTYDKVLYDPKTDTYYGLLYPPGGNGDRGPRFEILTDDAEEDDPEPRHPEETWSFDGCGIYCGNDVY